MATNKVEYVRLGKSGLKISVPIFGAMSFGSDKWVPWVQNEDAAFKVFKHAWDRGINTFDTSNNYSNGDSERVLAKWIVKEKIPRSQVVIMTKCWGLVGTGEDSNKITAYHPELQHVQKYQNQYGLSRAAIFNAVEGSLERLNTSYIDLLQIHRFDPHTPPEETMKALHDLVESGKVRYIGVSSMWTWQFALLNEVADKHNWTKFVSMQNEYSLLYREEEREMIPYCKFNGIALVPWGPLSAGALARPLDSLKSTTRSESWSDKTEDEKKIISRVEEVAKKRGTTMSRVALAWAMKNITSPIIGLSKPERVDDVIGLASLKLTDEEIKFLEEPYVSKPVRGLFDDW